MEVLHVLIMLLFYSGQQKKENNEINDHRSLMKNENLDRGINSLHLMADINDSKQEKTFYSVSIKNYYNNV